MAEKKKGLIYRLTMGKDNLPDFTPDRLPGTRFQQFKDVFFNRIGALVKINLLVLLFAVPSVIWVVLVMIMKKVDSTLVPYSGNLGLGYPVINDAVAMGNARAFSFDFQMYLVLILGIVILSIGLAGAFYVMRRLVWGEGITVAGHFFRGIKMNILPFLWMGLFCGISVFFVMFNFAAYNQMNMHVAWKVVFMAMSIIQCVLLMSMAMFMTTQAVTYKLKIWGLIKNSFLFAIALLPTNLIILVLSAIPIVAIALIPMPFGMFGYMIFALLGFSYIILLWTVYGHWAFDKFINDRVEGAEKHKGMYKKTEQDVKDKQERERKNNNIRFNNPKKRAKKITSIDEGETYTPLPTSFSRGDLARLAEEKEQVKKAIDAEYEESDGEDAELNAADDATAADISSHEIPSGEAESGASAAAEADDTGRAEDKE